MKLSILWPLLAAAFFSACASEDYEPYVTRGLYTGETGYHERFTLERSGCFGFCPAYSVTVNDSDILNFRGVDYVAESGGTVSKRLPDGSFKKLVAIAKSYDFAAFDAVYPNEDGSNCPQQVTDMPTVILSFETRKFEHSVNLYQGCMGFDGRERLDAMILEMDAVLDIGDWIGPRDAFMGADE